jgi:hypothetical protein
MPIGVSNNRGVVSNTIQSTAALGALSPTKAFSENRAVGTHMRELASRSRNGGAASVMLLPESGAKYQSYAFSYHTGKTKQMNLLQPPADGMFRGTVVVNVSGHDGAAKAKDYAESNTYNVRVTLPDGKVIQALNIPRNEPGKTEYSTKIPIEFPAMPGKTIVEAWPTGSAGVHGYIEGRRYSLNLGDQAQFSKAAADAEAKAWEAANPNPGDRQSPRPYGDF